MLSHRVFDAYFGTGGHFSTYPAHSTYNCMLSGGAGKVFVVLRLLPFRRRPGMAVSVK